MRAIPCSYDIHYKSKENRQLWRKIWVYKVPDQRAHLKINCETHLGLYGPVGEWSAFLIKDGLYRFEELDLISGVYYTGPNMVLEQLGYELEEPNGAPGWLRAELEHAAKAVDHWSAGMRKESHMSKREVYVCDRCGTQSNEKLATFYEDELNGPTQNDIASGKTESRHYTVDLCFPCVAIFARRMQETGDLTDFNKGFKRPVKPQF